MEESKPLRNRTTKFIIINYKDNNYNKIKISMIMQRSDLKRWNVIVNQTPPNLKKLNF